MNNPEKDKETLSWLTRAWDDYSDNLPLLLPVLLIQSALTAGSFYLTGRFQSLLAAAPYMLFVVTPFSIGLNLVYIKIARKSGPRFLDLFGAFPVYHRALAVSLLLGIMTLGGAVMFLIPGIILYLAFCFSEYAVVDRRTGIKESFLLSAKITQGWKGRLFAILSLLLLVNIMVPDIYLVTGPLAKPSASLDLKPWTIAAAALKNLVFIPWLSLSMARAYNFLLLNSQPAPVAE